MPRCLHLQAVYVHEWHNVREVYSQKKIQWPNERARDYCILSAPRQPNLLLHCPLGELLSNDSLLTQVGHSCEQLFMYIQAHS